MTRTIAVITGTRAEFGLLRPVMHAIRAHPALELRVLAAGTHLLGSPRTLDEVTSEFAVDTVIPMQIDGQTGRSADAAALGRGVTGFAQAFATIAPDVVLVLGDRIEAFAAAAAAAVGGFRVAHLHGGDRAEGIADEALRHAISKLAQLHLPATRTSAQRLIAMGEDPSRVHVVGSPAIDGLDRMPPMPDSEFTALGAPRIIVLLHPTGESDQVEQGRAAELLQICSRRGPALSLDPNHDPGRDGIVRAIERSGCRRAAHLPRDRFVGLLRRVRMIVGNSSAGLIESSAIPIRCVNVGSRQSGREKPGNVIDVPHWDYQTIEASVAMTIEAPPLTPTDVDHPYGDGRTGSRVATLLASIDLAGNPLKKRNSY